MQTAPNDTTLQHKEIELRNTYINIVSSSITLIKQQCKVDWIGLGDDSSRFFFAKAKQRKLATYIYHIKDSNGDPVEGFDQVGEMMVKFYKSLLGTRVNHRTPLRKEVLEAGPMLSLEQQVGLCQPFTDQEIRSTLFSILNHKSPGPDGYNSGFCATKLIMLPKVSHPQTALDF